MKRSLMICTLVGSSLGFVALAAPTQPEKKPADPTKTTQPAKPADKPTTPAKPAEKPAAPTQPGQPSKEDIDKAFAEMRKLSPEQERLKEFVGTWTADVKFYEPGAPEQSFKGEMVSTLIHGGKFVHHEFRGDFMGAAFTGSGDFGYNDLTKKYESTWMDGFDNAIQFSTGTYAAATRTYTSGRDFDMANPADGKVVHVKQREVVKVETPDKHVMTMYQEPVGVPDAKEMKVLEITYTRKK